MQTQSRKSNIILELWQVFALSTETPTKLKTQIKLRILGSHLLWKKAQVWNEHRRVFYIAPHQNQPIAPWCLLMLPQAVTLFATFIYSRKRIAFMDKSGGLVVECVPINFPFFHLFISGHLQRKTMDDGDDDKCVTLHLPLH